MDKKKTNTIDLNLDEKTVALWLGQKDLEIKIREKLLEEQSKQIEFLKNELRKLQEETMKYQHELSDAVAKIKQ